MLFMIIEPFKVNDMLPTYKRVRDRGRQLPEGLTYIDTWIEPNFGRCFQLMEFGDLRLLQQWTVQCRRLGATFEMVPAVFFVSAYITINPGLVRVKSGPDKPATSVPNRAGQR